MEPERRQRERQEHQRLERRLQERLEHRQREQQRRHRLEQRQRQQREQRRGSERCRTEQPWRRRRRWLPGMVQRSELRFGSRQRQGPDRGRKTG